jgi:hypothetical protein
MTYSLKAYENVGSIPYTVVESKKRVKELEAFQRNVW